jgi:hypothetical protein
MGLSFPLGNSGNVSLVLGRKTSLGRNKPGKDSLWGFRLGFENIEKNPIHEKDFNGVRPVQ